MLGGKWRWASEWRSWWERDSSSGNNCSLSRSFFEVSAALPPSLLATANDVSASDAVGGSSTHVSAMKMGAV